MTESRYPYDQDRSLISKRRQIQNYERRKTTLMWIGIIVVAALAVIILVNVLPPLFSKLDIVDTSYRPRDVERQYHQIQKLRDPRGGDPSKGGGS